MTNQEQIITPPQLVEQWVDMLSSRSDYAVFSFATQWGWDQHCAATEAELQQAADQELEACCEWLQDAALASDARDLRFARRPKESSLKKQALAELKKVDMVWDTSEFGDSTLSALDTIRRALEALPND